MIKLKTLISEAFIPDKSEFERAVRESEYKIIYVIMDNNGHVHIDDGKGPGLQHKNIKAKITLDYNNNTTNIYKASLHGNKINPNVQQLLSSLLKKGIIDSSWKTKFSDYEGYYLDSKYSYKMGNYEDLPPNFWKRNSRINLGENLILYHGTSEMEMPMINKYGLRPLGFKSTSSGYETRLRINENKDFIYLSGTFSDAFRYAQTRARSNMLKHNKEQYQWVEHREWQHWFIKPVVLLVTIPDFTNLRSDDDRVISLIKQKAHEIWSAMSPEVKRREQEISAKWFNDRNVNFTPESISDYLWVTSDNGCDQVLKHIDKTEWDNWKESIKVNNQVAYKGTIPPKYLKVIDLYDVTIKKR